MSLLVVFNEIKEIVEGFSVDSKYDILSLLDEISTDYETRNLLGIYEADSKLEKLKEKVAEDLNKDMTKIINTFVKDMKILLNNVENDFRAKLRVRG